MFDRRGTYCSRVKVACRFRAVTDMTKILSVARSLAGLHRTPLYGAGIMNIYRSLADIQDQTAVPWPEAVGGAAWGNDNLAAETMNTFFPYWVQQRESRVDTGHPRRVLWPAASPRYIDLLRKVTSVHAFLQGRFADFNGDIATYVVTHPDPGLLGAALICQEEHDDGR